MTAEALTAEEMREAEKSAYSRGITPMELMENAGSAVARFVLSHFSERNILVVCGKGNNGGDGFVAARILSKERNVTVALLGSGRDIKEGPALSNYKALKGAGVKVVERSYENASLTEGTDLVVDAIFGTGFTGAPRKEADALIRAINSSGLPVVSVDVPSGLDATTGDGTVKVNATYTVTFHRMKTGLLRSKGNGKVVVEQIGMD